MCTSRRLLHLLLALTLLGANLPASAPVHAQDGTATAESPVVIETVTPEAVDPTPDATTVPTVDAKTPVATPPPVVTSEPTPEVTPEPVIGPAVIPTGSATIHVVDDLAADVVGACLNVYLDAGGGTLGAYLGGFCDAFEEPNDAYIHLTNLPVGDLIARQINPPLNHSAAADLLFTVVANQTTERTIVNPRWGKVTITVEDQFDDPVTGSCFWAFADAGGGTKGSLVAPTLCDGTGGADDGTIVLFIPAGDVVLEQRTKPNGYLPTANQAFHLDPGQELAKTFLNNLPTTLIVRTVDVWGALVDRTDLHIEQTAGGNAEYHESTNGGTLKIPFLNPGTYEITASTQYTQPGYFPPANPVVVTIAELETKSVDVVFTQAAPTFTISVYFGELTPTSALFYWATDQRTVGEVRYGTTNALGKVAPSTPGTPAKVQRIRLGSLKTGTVYYIEAISHSPNGDIASGILTFKTPTSGQKGSLTVHLQRNTGQALKSSCWEVYRDASGALGDFAGSACDEMDGGGNDGSSTIGGLGAGTYWLVESLAPNQYKPIKRQKFTLASRQALELTITNTKGGATLVIMSRVDQFHLVPGVCFLVYVSLGLAGDGEYVGSSCDDLDGQPDGFTYLRGLSPGGYNIYETNVPEGMVPERSAGIYIQTYDKEVMATFENYSPSYKGNIIALAQTANGTPVPDACFWLYYNNGSGGLGEYYGIACDGDDGANDGKTFFIEMQAGSYILVEAFAPAGIVNGTKIAFTKTSSKQKVVKFKQIEGGSDLTVTTLKGTTSTKVKGACYGAYRLSGGQYEPVTLACDGWDGANDGVTKILALPNGSYRIYQTTTPSGYTRPAYVAVSISSANKAISIRINPR